MGCLKLTYDFEPILFLEEHPEKNQSADLQVWVNPDATFEGVGIKTLTQDDPLKKHLSESKSLEEFLAHYNSCTLAEIVTELSDKSQTRLGSQPGGPGMRYVRNPHDGNVIDMRHMLVVGFVYGSVLGMHLEIAQLFDADARQSALDPQDFYSNDLGSNFWFDRGIISIPLNPEKFTQYLSEFFQTPNRFNHKYRWDLIYDGVNSLKK